MDSMDSWMITDIYTFTRGSPWVKMLPIIAQKTPGVQPQGRNLPGLHQLRDALDPSRASASGGRAQRYIENGWMPSLKYEGDVVVVSTFATYFIRFLWMCVAFFFGGWEIMAQSRQQNPAKIKIVEFTSLFGPNTL